MTVQERERQTFKDLRTRERAFVETPLGALVIEASERGLTHVYLDSPHSHEEAPTPTPGSILAEAVRQLEQYFAGARREFDLPFDLDASEFERRVRYAAVAVGFGTVVSYGELAARAGSPRGARAAGNVMRNNPLMIVIPCHRVIGADGSLRGYGGLGCGLETKRWLLEFEGVEP